MTQTTTEQLKNQDNSEEQLDVNQQSEQVETSEIKPSSFEEQIAALEAKVGQYHDQLLRAHAEMENLRKRTHDEVAKARKFSTEAFAESLVPVRDSLEAALQQGEQTLEALTEGVETTLRQLVQAFERNALHVVDPKPGDKFDPNIHQAISSISSEEFSAGCIVTCLQKGYTIADRVLRPALVTVSSGQA